MLFNIFDLVNNLFVKSIIEAFIPENSLLRSSAPKNVLMSHGLYFPLGTLVVSLSIVQNTKPLKKNMLNALLSSVNNAKYTLKNCKYILLKCNCYFGAPKFFRSTCT